VTDPQADAFISELRQRITEVDRSLVTGLNRRLELVAELKRYKDSCGLEFVDPDRERALLELLAEANTGPLSGEGLRAFVTEVLALTKREVGAPNPQPASTGSDPLEAA
jgi:chorismate mutase